MQGATADAQFSALNATSATPRAKLRKRKAKFKPALFAPASNVTESHTNERRKFKPHSAAARATRDNKLTTLKRSVNACTAYDIDRITIAKSNFSFRSNLARSNKRV